MNRNKERWSPVRFLMKAGEALRFAPRDCFPKAAKENAVGRLAPIQSRALRVKLALAKMWEQSFFVTCAREVFRRFFLMRARALGVLFFTCGFLQIASYFLRFSLPVLAGDETGFLFGIALIFLTLLFSLSRSNLRYLLIRSAFFRRVLQPLFGVEEWQVPDGESHEPLLLMIALGILFWIAGLIFSPVRVFYALCLFCLASFILCRPEAGLIATALLFYFLPIRLFQALVLLTALSFLFKCAVGRRSLAFSPMDLMCAASLFWLLFLPRTDKVLLFISCFFVYYLSGCLLRSVSAIQRLFCAFCWAGFIVSFLLCVGSAVNAFLPSLFYRDPALSRLLTVQPTPQTGAVLVLLFPLCFGAFSTARTFTGRLLSLLTMLSITAGVAVVQNATIWLAFFVGVTIYVLLSYRTALTGLCFALLIAGSVRLLLPYDATKQILAFFGVSDASAATGQGGLQFLYGITGWLGVLLFLALICAMVAMCIRFARRGAVAQLYPYVLSALCAGVTLTILCFTAIPLDGKPIVMMCFVAAVPDASRRADARERVLLPY